VNPGTFFRIYSPVNQVLDIMFKTAPLTDIALLKKTWTEWNMMNWVRSAVILCGLIFSFIGLDRIYLLK